jgi:hypothetical protein
MRLFRLHSRFTDDDMKQLMIDCVDHCYFFLSILFTTENSNKIIDILAQEDRLPDWKEPEISDALVERAKKALALLEQSGVTGLQWYAAVLYVLRSDFLESGQRWKNNFEKRVAVSPFFRAEFDGRSWHSVAVLLTRGISAKTWSASRAPPNLATISKSRWRFHHEQTQRVDGRKFLHQQ